MFPSRFFLMCFLSPVIYLSSCTTLARTPCNLFFWGGAPAQHPLPPVTCMFTIAQPLPIRPVKFSGVAQHSLPPVTCMFSCTALANTSYKIFRGCPALSFTINLSPLLHCHFQNALCNFFRAAQHSLPPVTCMFSCTALANTSYKIFRGCPALSFTINLSALLHCHSLLPNLHCCIAL